MKLEITEIEAMRICICLWNEALRHDAAADHYKKMGYRGIEQGEHVEASVLMKLREKFRVVI